MDFTSFDIEFSALLDRGILRRQTDFVVELERLRELADQVEPATDKEKAHRLITKLNMVMANQRPPVSDATTAATSVQRRARNAQGSPPERITAIRAGKAEIGSTADTATPEEQADSGN
jgi:hypothetical protein